MSSWVTIKIDPQDMDEERKEEIAKELSYKADQKEHFNKLSDTGFGMFDDDLETQEEATKIAKELMEEGEEVLMILANDTTDAGTGYLYKLLEDGTLNRTRKIEGYEGCKARDVVGRFEDDYGFRGHAYWR